MSNPQGSDNGYNVSRKDSFNLVYAVARGHALCFIPFFRKNFGSEALRPGLISLVIMLAVGSFGRIPEMWPFLGVWLFAMLCQRASTMRAMRRGVMRHSRYDGDVDEKMAKLFRSRVAVKQIIEPLACVALAVFFEEYLGTSHGFALFFGWGAFSMAMVAMIDRTLDNKRLEAMRDAEIEGRYLTARYRGEIE
jgi:hypothetical protein